MTMRLLVIGLVGCAVAAYGADKDAAEENKWEKTIQRFEAQDKESPPEKGGILIVGSSSARLWDVDKWFPDLDVINRGFGGSMFSDLNHFAERVVLPYAPRVMVVYSGDNDIANGKSADEVFADFERFLAWVHTKLPETRMVLMSTKPSIARWKLFPKMQEVNQRIEQVAQKDPLLDYIDGGTSLLGTDGKPRTDVLLDDGLHLNDQGYAIWTKLVRPHLEEKSTKEGRNSGITGTGRDGAKKGLSSRVREQGLSLFLRAQNRDRPVSLEDSLACVSPGFA